MTTATIDSKALEALIQPRQLARQGFVAPTRVLVDFGTDHAGADACFVYLVFPDDTNDSALAWNKVKDMVRWVQDRIWSAVGEQRWPYVRVKRESELLAQLTQCPG
jgi:hypothetical protein